MNRITKSLNSNKATDPDSIPLKVIKMAPNIIDLHLASNKNKDLTEHQFSDVKTALVRPIYKKDN